MKKKIDLHPLNDTVGIKCIVVLETTEALIPEGNTALEKLLRRWQESGLSVFLK